MTRVQIKICGLRSTEELRLCAELGVDAVGMVFVPESVRAVTIAQARALLPALGPFTTLVGLFLDAPRSFIEEVLAEVPLDQIQFHGRESAADCERFNRPYLKALAMGSGVDLCASAAHYPSARGLLVDSNAVGQLGGSGHAFDWRQLGCARPPQPLILAGGLTAQNVAQALTAVAPDALDVSSGVEVTRGVKDLARMRAFVTAVRDAAVVVN